jgi:hypothetical protein
MYLLYKIQEESSTTTLWNAVGAVRTSPTPSCKYYLQPVEISVLSGILLNVDFSGCNIPLSTLAS